MFIRRTLRKGVKINGDIDDDSVELILDKGLFGFDKKYEDSFYICQSSYLVIYKVGVEKSFRKIETFVYDGRNSLLVMGGLNGRTRTDEDFVRDRDDKHSPITDIFSFIQPILN